MLGIILIITTIIIIIIKIIIVLIIKIIISKPLDHKPSGKHLASGKEVRDLHLTDDSSVPMRFICNSQKRTGKDYSLCPLTFLTIVFVNVFEHQSIMRKLVIDLKSCTMRLSLCLS